MTARRLSTPSLTGSEVPDRSLVRIDSVERPALLPIWKFRWLNFARIWAK